MSIAKITKCTNTGNAQILNTEEGENEARRVLSDVERQGSNEGGRGRKNFY